MGIIQAIKEAQFDEPPTDPPESSFIHDYIERIFALGSKPSMCHVHYKNWAELTGKTQKAALEWLNEYAIPLEHKGWYEVRR